MNIAGVDEVGRGCLAGDVFAAAVIFPTHYKNEVIKDSKKLSEVERKKLVPIIQKDALAVAIGRASVDEIEKFNILGASILAMHRALESIHISFDKIEVDGNRFKPFQHIPHECIVKGDQTHIHIAAASIIAKCARDDYMKELDQLFPTYLWRQNKGYPTLAHRKAIHAFGACEYHRKTFDLLGRKEQ